MTGFWVFEIALLALIIAMVLWFRSRHFKQWSEYQELKKKCEHAAQRRQEAEQAALRAVQEETLAKQNLLSIQENVKNGLEQLRVTEQTLIDQERIVREKLEQERAIFVKQMLEERNEIFLETQREFAEQFAADNRQKLAAAQALTDQVIQLKSTVASAVEIAKHKMEEETAQDFYRLQLPEESVQDIEALRSIESLLHNPEAINKVIWKMYYEKPYTDLIGRVGLTNTVCGIYKITNIENQMTYVGQAVNIADRWKQHIKRGVGADAPTANKLYPAMKKFGPENFTFEIIEQCSRAKLNEREDYWQEFYKAKEFGYSIK